MIAKKFLSTLTPQAMQKLPQNDPLKQEITSLYNAGSMAERLKAAQHAVNLDDVDMKAIVCQYIQDTPIMMDNLKEAWQATDYAGIVLYAHSLVGVTRLLNLNKLGGIAHNIESLAKKDLPCDKITFKKLYYHYEASFQMLKQLYPCP